MNSDTLFEQAAKLIPGGVNSPVRAFNSVGGHPIYFAHAKGSQVTDVEGKTYTDFCGSWGPLILGHAPDCVLSALESTAPKGVTFGACHPLELEMAAFLNHQIPEMEMVRMVNSGTEATMSALRLARGYTGRQKIIKFDGCYHGHADYLLVNAGSGLLTSGTSSSAGVSQHAVADVIVAPYNDVTAVEEIFDRWEDEIAAVIVEPIAGNMGLVPPAPGFLERLREITRGAGALLIFDEVITGFRLGATAYAHLAGIVPDLICLGKIIGGGLPAAAFGGRKEIMRHLAPLGPVYQAGTLSGNPLALAAGLATLKVLRDETPYPRLERYAQRIADALNEADVGVTVTQLGGMFTIFFRDGQPRQLAEVQSCDTARFAAFHRKMLDNGYYLSPSQYELGFISAAHTEAEIDHFIATAIQVLQAI